MNQSFDVSTIIFAALAIFIVWKLRSVLGTRTGEERPPFNPFLRRTATKSEDGRPTTDGGNVIPLPGATPSAQAPVIDPDRWRGVAEPGSPVADCLDRIVGLDPSFSGRGFLDGARIAYEMITEAFAKGDRAALSGLLSKDVYKEFVAAIGDRETRGEKVDHTFVSLDRATLEHADLRGNQAQLTVFFQSHQINATRIAGGALAEGSADGPVQVMDHWTFARDLSAQDPNWALVATSAE